VIPTTRPVELRATSRPVELRANRSSRTVGGYASVFGKASRNLGGFIEIVDRRAFNKSRADGFPEAICRFNHSDDALLGTTASGTLQLGVDTTGLHYDVDLPECRADVLELITRGDVTASSFAFQCYEDDWGTNDSGSPVRTLLQCRLVDVAPVTNPAYQDATVGLRSLARFVGAPYEDVRELSRGGELRKLFTRSDVQPLSTQGRGLSPADARVQLMDMRYRGGSPRVRKTVHQQVSELQARRWPDDESSS
jgi:HK97 family phage prohead protease